MLFPETIIISENNMVPETGFEPARRFQRYHLKVVRLPISPPGYSANVSRFIVK